jgi:Xaa-Pro dipeptidase
MGINRRKFLGAAAGVAAATTALAQRSGTATTQVPASIRNLRPFPGAATPISDAERLQRMEKARRLMAENKLAAIYLEPGSSMFYFTGIRWSLSERMFGMVFPAKGEIAYVVPGFEEARARELIRFGKDVRVWQEDEPPAAVVAGVLKDRGITTGTIGIEERTRFFLYDGIRKAAPALQYEIATPVTAGCRMIKSAAEIALMQRANDITIEAFRAALGALGEGMNQQELGANISAAFQALGSSGGALVGLGHYSAFPHGSIQPQQLREGDIVLIDGGCGVEGYESDITRTTVFGKPSEHQRKIWDLEHQAQSAAFAAAQVGATCESVDAAARKVITDAGMGPGYKVPGLPHRTGHGIGLDGHEWTNFVKGNKTKIAPGMCFSDEPMITNYDEFGIRLEDCLYITESGPRFFSKQSVAIDQPFG